MTEIRNFWTAPSGFMNNFVPTRLCGYTLNFLYLIANLMYVVMTLFRQHLVCLLFLSSKISILVDLIVLCAPFIFVHPFSRKPFAPLYFYAYQTFYVKN